MEFQTPYKFQTLNPEGLNKGKRSRGPPTLKGLAAQVRYMVPLLPVLTNKYLDMNLAHDLACQRLARFLAQAYEAMECNDTAALLKAGQKMAQQYVELVKEALEKENTTDFHIMPKLHLSQHLCEMKHPPTDPWCYKDETWTQCFRSLGQVDLQQSFSCFVISCLKKALAKKKSLVYCVLA